ncbi:MAG TPA: D-glycero-beta-D-manno-heptose 1-phosphate adenylyltransferase [Jatrophihabitans sp.]|nr:D-glycero-beta-D-manno-heptose 1-phosphate adenylyltransferase [Jatrophihabitans sp.]
MSEPIAVVGDVMLDVDLIGHAGRLSPDAPVPVLDDVVTRSRPGGAALAATMAAAGREVYLITPMVDDDAGRELQRLLPKGVRLVALPGSGETAVKTRIRAGEHALARIDRGSAQVLPTAVPDEAAQALAAASAVLVADYGRGLTADPRMRDLLAITADRRPLAWDPHPRGRPPVPGTTVATPNAAELFALSGAAGSTRLAGAAAAAGKLRAQWQLPWLSATLGERGALLDHAGGHFLVAAEPATGGDPCGAGDAYAAGLTGALADGALMTEAVQHAVSVAGDWVRYGRAAVVPTARLDGAAAAVADRVRARGGTVVATGGCFDLLHPGHVAVLQAARAWGDCLIVCLNSDESIRRIKGPDRPVQSERARAAVLSALACVDAVAVFGEDTPEQVLRELRPDVWVKGGDYSATDLPEAPVVRSWGGVTATVPYRTGLSTSALVDKIRLTG